jgi:hypothetical protein
VLRRISLSILAASVLGLPGTATAQQPTAVVQPVAAAPAPTATAATPPSATRTLPTGTAGLFMVNTSPATWGEMQKFRPPGVIPLDIPLSFLGFDYREDIQSWLGDYVAIAVLPVVSDTDTFLTNAVALFPTLNPDKSNALLDKFKSMAPPTAERTYKTIPILEWTAPKAPEAPETPAGEHQCGETPKDGAEACDTPSGNPSPADEPAPTTPDPATAPKMGHGTLEPSLVQAFWPQFAASPVTVQQARASQFHDEGNPSGGTSAPSAPGFGSSFAVALLPGQIAIAPTATALERLIDAQGTPNLAQSTPFQRTLQHPQFPRAFSISYGEYATLLKLLNQSVPPLPSDPGNPDSPKKPLFTAGMINLITQRFSTFDSLNWVRSNGIQAETNIYFTSPQPARATPNLPDANQILTRLPAITYLSGNSRNFKQQWQTEFLDYLADDPDTSKALAEARKFLRQGTGMDLEKDLIGWMDGEYAAFLYPTQEGFFNYINRRANIGAGILVQTSDRPRAEMALAKLGEWLRTSTAKTSSPATIAQRQVKGEPVTSWEVKDGNRILSLMSYSWVSPDTVLITTGIGATQGLTPKPYLPLHLNPTFTTATQDLVKPNDGFMYINVGSTLSFIYGMMREFVPAEVMESPYSQTIQAYLGSIRSMSATQTTTPDKIQAESLWVLGTYAPKPDAPTSK